MKASCAPELVARDGTRLHTEVHLPPVGEGPWPVLLMRTPYGCADQRVGARELAGRGMACVVQDVRGRFGSTGTFDFGSHDATDGTDTLAWVRHQDFCDGRVATRGVSYGAFTQWSLLAERPPGLVCAAPVMGPTPWAGLDFRRGGATELAALAHWVPAQAATAPGIGAGAADALRRCSFDPAAVLDVSGRRVDPRRALADQTLQDLDRTTAALEVAPPFAQRWRQALEGGADGAGTPPDLAGLDTSVLVVAGWHDPFTGPALDAFAALGTHEAGHRLVITGFGHGFDPPREHPPTTTAWRFPFDVDVCWAEEHLGLRDHGLRRLDPVTWYVVGADRWRSGPCWPPPEARPHRLHLHPAGRLVPVPPPVGVVELRHEPSDPVPTRGGAGMLLPPGPAEVGDLDGAHRGDVVSFDCSPSPDPVELAGPVTVGVTVGSTRPVADVVARLAHVGPGGDATVIATGICRVHGVADRPRSVVVSLGHVAHLVPAGHALRLDLCTSDHPRHDVRPELPARHRFRLGGARGWLDLTTRNGDDP